MTYDESDVIDRILRRRHLAAGRGGTASIPPSVLGGRGIFTVEHPEYAHDLKCYTIAATDQDTWEARGAVIRQAETPAEYERALQAGHAGYVEGALVTNLDEAFLGLNQWPTGWTCLPECYWNADGGLPNVGRSVSRMLWEASKVMGDQWGSVPVVPVIGCYDASRENPGIGRRLTVADYMPELLTALHAFPWVVGYVVWRAETLSAADVEALTA